MTFRNMSDNFNKHFHENFGFYLISILFISTGIILGIYCVKYLSPEEKNAIIKYVAIVENSSTLSYIDNKLIFIQALKNNLPIVIGFWFLGLTIVGIPFILMIDILKGFSLGFTFSFFVQAIEKKGAMLSVLGVLPQNLIYIPCIILFSVISMELSLGLVKEKLNRNYNNSGFTIMGYTSIFIGIFIVMTMGFLIEVFLTPTLIELTLKGLG